MIKVNLNKAKEIAHQKRRANRSDEFKPYDEIIMKQIHGNDAIQTESERQKIRDKYDVLQKQIDQATNVEELKILLC